MNRTIRTIALITILTGAATAVTPGLAVAQVGAIMPEAPLEASRARVRDALLVLRDSLHAIDGANARLRRDFRVTSAAALSGRARSIADACAGAERTVPGARKAVEETRADTRFERDQRAALLRSLDDLAGTLGGCRSDFVALGSKGGEQVRGYGNRRAESLQSELRKYDRTVAGFFATYKIEVRPIGAGKNPLAG
jgi:hypothetical protein